MTFRIPSRPSPSPSPPQASTPLAAMPSEVAKLAGTVSELLDRYKATREDLVKAAELNLKLATGLRELNDSIKALEERIGVALDPLPAPLTALVAGTMDRVTDIEDKLALGAVQTVNVDVEARRQAQAVQVSLDQPGGVRDRIGNVEDTLATHLAGKPLDDAHENAAMTLAAHVDKLVEEVGHVRDLVVAANAKVEGLEEDVRTVFGDLARIRTAQEEAYRLAHPQTGAAT